MNSKNTVLEGRRLPCRKKKRKIVTGASKAAGKDGNTMIWYGKKSGNVEAVLSM